MGFNAPRSCYLVSSTLIFTLIFTLNVAQGKLAVSDPSAKLAKPDYSIYHNLKETLDAATETVNRCPQFMKIEERTKTMGNYSSTMKIVTVKPGGPTENDEHKLRLLINYGEHGRELISTELALRLLETLCDPIARAKVVKKFKLDAGLIEQLLHNVVFKIIPMENPRGRELVEGGELCERKNGRGVDPNRNWGVHWGFKEQDYDPKEEFPGLEPFSEPEPAIIKALAEGFKPHVWANVHSGMEAMFLPYDHKNEVPKGPAAEATLDLLDKLNKQICNSNCAVGPGGKTVGYLAHGTATDYMHDVLKTGIAMTWEVYGDDDANWEDCFKMFNPLDRAIFNDVVDRWTGAIYALVAALPGHPGVPQEALQFDKGKTDKAGSALGRKFGARGGGLVVVGGDKLAAVAVGDGVDVRGGDSTAIESLRELNGGGFYSGGYLPQGTGVLGYAALGIACIAGVGYVVRATPARRFFAGRIRLGKRNIREV